jgi:hypothetical protein
VIRTETFELHQSRLKLHLCPMAQMPIPVETEEVREAHALVSRSSIWTTPQRTVTLSRTRELAPSRVQRENMT